MSATIHHFPGARTADSEIERLTKRDFLLSLSLSHIAAVADMAAAGLTTPEAALVTIRDTLAHAATKP